MTKFFDINRHKYRAWDGNKMIYSIATNSSLGIILSDGLWQDDLDKYEIMDYIGKDDINSKHIYEGDYIDDENYDYIKFCNDCISYQAFYKFRNFEYCHSCEGDYRLNELDDMEVFGNIFEN